MHEAIADFARAKRSGLRGREADLWTYTAQMMSGGRERSDLDNKGPGAEAAEAVRVWEVNGPDVAAMNSFEDPRRVDARERRASARGSTTCARPTPSRSGA